MRVRYLIAGLGACLIGWTALALGQPGMEPVKPAPPPVEPRVVAPEAPAVPAPVKPLEPPAPAAVKPLEPSAPAAPIPLLGSPSPLPTPEPIVPAAAKQPEPAEPALPGEAPPSVRQEPSVCLEWVGPARAKVGQVGDFALLVRNTSTIPVQQVLVRVRIPDGMAIAATEPRAVQENNVLMWDLATLMPRQEKTLLLKLQSNTKGELKPQAWVTFTGSSVMRVRVYEPRLALKASSAREVLVGETASFSLTVTNPGDGSADRVKIRASMSPGLGHANGPQVEFDIGNLAAGETRNVQLLCQTRTGGTETVEAVAEAEGGLTARDTAQVLVIMPRLDLVLHGPGLKFLERKGQYTLKVTNPGNVPATNVTVTDVVPPGFKVLAASDGGRHDEATRNISWFLGEIGPGQTREVKFEALAVAVGAHKHRAVASGARGLHAETEFVTRVEGLSALMLEVIDTEDPIEVGSDTAYEVRVINSGSQTETDIKLVATIPDKMELKSAQGPVRFRAEGKNIVFEPIERLAPRGEGVFRIVVKALEPGTVRFQVRMTSTNLPEPVIKMEATRIYSDAALDSSSNKPQD